MAGDKYAAQRRWKQRNKATPRYRYMQQKGNAQSRGIAWGLTFDQWWSLWWPYWSQRGCDSDNYVMSRFGDSGPYCVGNVAIITNAENVSEARRAA